MPSTFRCDGLQPPRIPNHTRAGCSCDFAVGDEVCVHLEEAVPPRQVFGGGRGGRSYWYLWTSGRRQIEDTECQHQEIDATANEYIGDRAARIMGTEFSTRKERGGWSDFSHSFFQPTDVTCCPTLQAYPQLVREHNFQQQDSWGLYDLSIYLGRHRDDGVQVVAERLEDNMMVHLVQFLPTVKSFKGRGSVWPSYPCMTGLFGYSWQ